MCFRQAAVHLERLKRKGLGFSTSVRRCDKPEDTKPGKAIGQACESRGKARIFSNGLLEVLHSLSIPLSSAPVPVITPLQIGFVCLGIDRPRLCELCLLLRCQLDLDFPCNGPSDISL